MTDPISDVLNRAADRLEQPGVWAQKGLLQPDHECIAIALLNSDEGGRYFDGACRLFKRTTGVDVITFNDDPKRTAAEAVTALRQAAQLREAE